MSTPIICFGQQPCGFFPKRFLAAKIQTARRLQQELGGRIIFFLHDSDHDPRETRVMLRHRKTHELAHLNFTFANKIQRKYSPLYLKQITADWQERTAGQLPNYVGHDLMERFRRGAGANAADFCLSMYRELQLLEGIEIVRSSDPAVRGAAGAGNDFFVDVPYEGETVRARWREGVLQLHEGGDVFITLPATTFTKEQISPTRDTRWRWMQSVVHCTHYIAGLGEKAYLNLEEAPEISLVTRDLIDRADEAYIEISS
jgi:hypothetical protein